MVRRVKSKYKKDLASRTWGGGNTKNRRNKGSTGGKGWAGSHKHKWSYVVKYAPDHFGKGGFAPTPATRRARYELMIVNVGYIYDQAKLGKLEKKDGKMVFKFEGKVLGGGDIKMPVVVLANAFSERAKEKIAAAGGSAEAIGG